MISRTFLSHFSHKHLSAFSSIVANDHCGTDYFGSISGLAAEWVKLHTGMQKVAFSYTVVWGPTVTHSWWGSCLQSLGS